MSIRARPSTSRGAVRQRSKTAALIESRLDGSGLRLCIAQQIVSAHGGRIDYTSQLGKGTTFQTSLPTVGAYNARRCNRGLKNDGRGEAPD